MTDLDPPTAPLARLERFYDAVPRTGARTEDLGPFTLFISLGGWPFYSRPRLGYEGIITPADVAAMRERQRQLRVPETGAHQAVDGVTEIVGVATLPAARRCGLGAAVTSALIEDALGTAPAHGRRIDTVFLSAASEDVARVYERLGFERIGHAGLAEPSDQERPVADTR